YVVTDAINTRCLASDDSLFTPGEAIWTLQAAAEVEAAVAHDDVDPDRTFAEKLHDHLAAVPRAGQLAAEMLYLVLLPEADTGAQMKLQRVKEVLQLLPDRGEIPTELRPALNHGIATYGVGGR